MSTTNTTDDPTKNDTVTPAVPPLTPPPGAVDTSNHPSPGVTGIVRRWKREDLLKRGSIGLRALGLLFSLLTFIIMASNKHGGNGGWMNFDKYEEYRYVLTVSILSTLYAGFQAIKQVREISTGRSLFDQRSMAFVDFFGDQIQPDDVSNVTCPILFCVELEQMNWLTNALTTGLHANV